MQVSMEDRQLRQVRRKLIDAISCSSVEQFKQILSGIESPLDLNADYKVAPENFPPLGDGANLMYHTLLQSAICTGCANIVNFLLDSGADVNGENRKGDTPLHAACTINSLPFVKLLLRRGADPNIPSDKGRTPLMIACVQNALPIVRELLGAKANADYTDCYGESALHLILGKGNISSTSSEISRMVDCLARHGCDVSHINNGKMTALMLAASQGNTDVIQTLILADCDLDCVNAERHTALYLAVSNDHTNAVRLLLQNGADISIADWKRVTPLHLGVKRQNTAIINIILSTQQGGSTIDIPDYEGTTPILHSVKAASLFKDVALNSVAGDITQTLLSKGCDVNVPHMATGWIPLFAAALTGNTALAQLLLSHGSDVNMTDKVGETVLHITVGHSGNPSLISMLISAGCDVNIRNKSGHTALYKAVVHRRNIQVVEMLIEAGTDLESVDYTSNTTALHIASTTSTDTSLLLIDRGANINHVDAMGSTVLAKAIQSGMSEVTGRLLSLHHCDVNTGTHSIPLHAAVRRTEEHLIYKLVSLGADINKTDQQGMRPIQVAIEANQRRIVRALLKLGCSLDPTETSQLPVPKSCCHQYHDPHPHAELQPLFAAVKFDDLDLFKMLLSHYYRKPYALLQVIHDMLTIAYETGSTGNRMMSVQGRQQLLDLLRHELITPSTLLELCRGEVRRCIGVGVASKVKSREVGVSSRVPSQEVGVASIVSSQEVGVASVVSLLSIPTSMKHYLVYDTDRHLDLSDLEVIQSVF